MKLNIVPTGTLLAVLLSVCEVLCFPHRGALDHKPDPGLQVILTSAGIKESYMNLSVDPCDDFYEYVCGNWKNVHPIEKDMVVSSVFVLLYNNIQNFLRESLSGYIPPSCVAEELNAEEKAMVYFAACVDEDTIEKRGSEPLLQFIDELGGWPVLDEEWSKENSFQVNSSEEDPSEEDSSEEDSSEEEFDWLQLAIKTSLLRASSILVTFVDADLQDPTRYSLFLDEPYLPGVGSVNRKYFPMSKYKEHLDDYKDIIVLFLLRLGVDECRARNAASEIVDFERQLANITSDNSRRIEGNPSTTIEGLCDRYPYIDWMTYLSGVQETPLEPNQTVVLLSESYYDNLGSILNETPPRTLANFMVWRAILHFATALDTDLFKSLQVFEKLLAGLEESPKRWKHCVAEVDHYMGMVTGAMFVRQHFDESSKTETISLLSDLKEAFRESLLAQDWIDEKTKAMLQGKLNQIRHFIGYPDFILSPEELDEFYSDLRVIPDKYAENRVNLAKYSERVRRRRLHEKVNEDVDTVEPTVVNAFYSPIYNKIYLPAGIIQPPFYVKNAKAENLAGIGTVLGHELTHAFDQQSVNYDSSQNRSWGSEALKEFKERVNCFIEQYGNYSIDGQFINGSLTRNENIADNGGLSQALRVYRKLVNLHGTPRQEMSSLKLTKDQLFFVGFAQCWCEVLRPNVVEAVLKDVHSPDKFRVIGTLSNFEEFSDAFQCPVGSFMNPEKKCRLW